MLAICFIGRSSMHYKSSHLTKSSVTSFAEQKRAGLGFFVLFKYVINFSHVCDFQENSTVF